MVGMGMFRRPSFLIVVGLLLVYLIVGLLGGRGILSATLVTNAMDLMMWMGIGLAMAVIMSYAGYVSFGHTVFIGLGGFATAYIVGIVYRDAIQQAIREQILAGVPASEAKVPLGMSIELLALSMILGSILAVITAAIVGWAVLRLRGAFFAIATIGVNYVVMNLVVFAINNWGPFVEKAQEQGLGRFGNEVLFVKTGWGIMDFYWMSYAAFVITILVAYIVRVSKLGYGLAAIREDEDAAEVVGVDTFRYKMIAFMIAAWLASLWGVVRTVRSQGFTVETEFSLLNSVIMILENAVGGIGTFVGPLIGALIYYPLKWYTQTLAGQAALLVLGALIIVVVSFAPGGIAGILRRLNPRLRKILE